MPNASKTRPAKTDRSLVLFHDECEHTGDIDRDHQELRRAGLAFSVKFASVANGPEVGASVIVTRATDAQIRKALAKAESCASLLGAGDRRKVEDVIAEEEGMYAHEYGDDY